jgi:hypothetical protein
MLSQTVLSHKSKVVFFSFDLELKALGYKNIRHYC